jgi:hypothetical protein
VSILRDRWRSRKHVGSAKPQQRVEIQEGHFEHDYSTFTLLDGRSPDFGIIAGNKHNAKPWRAHWVPDGDWIEVPNVEEVTLEEEFASEGVADPESATIRIGNIIYEELTGPTGLQYHKPRRGWMAPFYGFKTRHRPRNPKAPTPNEWMDLLNGGVKIRVFQGYGDEQVETFVGFIDDTDTVSVPATITLTCRDAGQLLTDQRLAGKVKPKDLQGPITFADRRRAMNYTKEGYHARSSSHVPGHSADKVLVQGVDEYWMSEGVSEEDRDNHTVYVEIELKSGRYPEYYVWTQDAGMEVWVSIYAKDGDDGPTRYGGVDRPEGWIDVGMGTVPGDDFGGMPYVQHFDSMDHRGKYHKLPLGQLHCKKGTVMRLSFRNLQFSPAFGNYHAKVARFFGHRAEVKDIAKNKDWILVDDAADIVKWVLMWAGFREWRITNFGVRIKNPMTFHQADFLIDVIKHIASQGEFVFFMDKPSGEAHSMGVPCFRRTHAIDPPRGGAEQVRDSDLLTGVETKFSKETLAQVIRVRGKPNKTLGVGFGEDSTKKIQGEYWPPWSGRHTDIETGEPTHQAHGRLSGIIKILTHGDPHVKTNSEAMMMCILIAFQEALTAYVGTIEIPAYPGFALDSVVSVIDTATGMNTLLWVAHKSSTFTTGQQTAWTMTLSGAILDSEMMRNLRADYKKLLKVTLSEAQE